MEPILKFLNLQKGRHSLTLLNGNVVKGGDTFEAKLSDVPEAFRDCVRVVSAGESAEAKMIRAGKTPGILKKRFDEEVLIEKPATEQEVPEPIKEVKEKRVFKKKHVGGGKYNVLDDKDVIQNEKPLTGIKAQQLIDYLMD